MKPQLRRWVSLAQLFTSQALDPARRPVPGRVAPMASSSRTQSNSGPQVVHFAPAGSSGMARSPGNQGIGLEQHSTISAGVCRGFRLDLPGGYRPGRSWPDRCWEPLRKTAAPTQRPSRHRFLATTEKDLAWYSRLGGRHADAPDRHLAAMPRLQSHLEGAADEKGGSPQNMAANRPTLRGLGDHAASRRRPGRRLAGGRTSPRR
jgi:hypothetical protein